MKPHIKRVVVNGIPYWGIYLHAAPMQICPACLAMRGDMERAKPACLCPNVRSLKDVYRWPRRT